MRIAQVALLAESVPPRLYGGTERVVSWLTEELVECGHEVTLFATGDSSTRARLVPVWPQGLRLGQPRSDPAIAQAAALEALARCAKDFDVIHCHMDWVHLPVLAQLGVPFLTTLHGPSVPVAISMPEGLYANQLLNVCQQEWRIAAVCHGCFPRGFPYGLLRRLVCASNDNPHMVPPRRWLGACLHPTVSGTVAATSAASCCAAARSLRCCRTPTNARRVTTSARRGRQ